jgi:hypothetical protein
MRTSTRRLLGQEEPPPKTPAEALEDYVYFQCTILRQVVVVMGAGIGKSDYVYSACPSLTYKQRLIGFGICLTMGFILTTGSIFRITQLILGNPVPFVINYSIGK